MTREKYIEKLKAKQKKGEKLNFIEIKVVGLIKSYDNGYSSESWVNDRIDAILKKR